MRPKISILYSLARSGGTLISRCLGCIPGNVLLSEIHPRYSFFHPLVQARDWFDLITEDELLELKSIQKISYIDSIKLISERCQERGLHLIIRDWTHIDFITSPYPAQPVYRLSQHDALAEHFDVREVALVRNPVDSYLSLAKLEGFKGALDLSVYMREFRLFAEAISTIGFIRYEDFCDAPHSVLQRICGILGVEYDDHFISWYREYKNVTGDLFKKTKNRTLAGDRAGERSQDDIKCPPRRAGYVAIREQLEGNDDFQFLNTLLSLGHALMAPAESTTTDQNSSHNPA